MTDPYLTKIHEHWSEITGMFRLFEQKNPIIEFDVQKLQILAYPFTDYLNCLTERTVAVQCVRSRARADAESGEVCAR